LGLDRFRQSDLAAAGALGTVSTGSSEEETVQRGVPKSPNVGVPTAATTMGTARAAWQSLPRQREPRARERVARSSRNPVFENDRSLPGGWCAARAMTSLLLCFSKRPECARRG